MDKLKHVIFKTNDIVFAKTLAPDIPLEDLILIPIS